jgi:hypothetical protein
LFPGFSGFAEPPLLEDRQLAADRFKDFPVPDVGRLRLVSIVEVGIFAVRATPADE